MSPVAPASSKILSLRDRALMLAEVRRFFDAQGVMEVDCPACISQPSVDAHIDLICTIESNGEHRYLHSSPEYAMKRLLAEGSGDIYQLSHVFRDGEIGENHNPEFMMIEWYRVGVTLEMLVLETAQLIMLFLGEQKLKTLTYREALKKYAAIDYATASDRELLNCVLHSTPAPSEKLCRTRDDLLNHIMGCLVEPNLGKEGLVAIVNYPATQCALAETETSNGITIARRFELYYQGRELCNGYQELRNGEELRRRFLQANEQRSAGGKNPLPLDEKLLEILHKMPPCCGVAVGFDRLMMLRQNVNDIKKILPFHWYNA